MRTDLTRTTVGEVWSRILSLDRVVYIYCRIFVSGYTTVGSSVHIVFWVATTCLVEIYGRFGETYCLHLHHNPLKGRYS
jgi:hypothetical protein